MFSIRADAQTGVPSSPNGEYGIRIRVIRVTVEYTRPDYTNSPNYSSGSSIHI